MSFNLKDELNKLSNTAPVLKDLDDYSDDETRAKVSEKSREYENELDADGMNDGSRRIRASIGDLSEYGKRYKGKSVSRKQMDFDREEGDEDEDIEDEEEGDDDEEEDIEGSEEDDEDEEEEDDDEEDEDSDGEVKVSKKSKNSDGEPNVMNYNHKEEVAKGKAVKNQLKFWDILLESRIKLQNLLNTVNQFPQNSYYDHLIKNLTDDFKKNNASTTNENQEYLLKVINQLVELQQRLVFNDPEANYIINDLKLNLNESKTTSDGPNEDSDKLNLKRKRMDSEGNSEESDDQLEEEKDDEDEEDEEIYSDTDEEMRANEIKKAKKQKKLKNYSFSSLKPEEIEKYLENFNQSFKKYRDSTIQKWYDKTRLSTGKSFEALEKPILQQIQHVLMDKDRIVKRTQLKRGQYKIVGKEETNKDDEENLKDRHLKDYDPEIYDDQDFYNQLLRELIDRKTNNVSDPIELSRQAIELQKLRSKNKKKVDTKASKGRKIKFDIHKPLVNFMAPIYRSTMSEEAKNELFRSLFSNHVTTAASNDKLNGSRDADVDFSALFKGF